MKKLISIGFILAVLIISSCSDYRGGELTGVPGRARWSLPGQGPSPTGIQRELPRFFSEVQPFSKKHLSGTAPE